MKTRKFKPYLGLIGDQKNLEPYFTEQAEKGWMLEKITGRGHYFRATEPTNLQFLVDLAPDVTVFDHSDCDAALSHRELYTDRGWEFAASHRELQVFYAPAEAKLETYYTTQREEAEILQRACSKQELLPLLIAIVYIGLITAFLLSQGVRILLSDMQTFFALGLGLFALPVFWTTLFSLQWYIRARISARIPRVNRRLMRLRHGLFRFGAAAFMVCIAIGVTLELLGGTPLRMFAVLGLYIAVGAVASIIMRNFQMKKRDAHANKSIYYIFVGIVICLAIFVVPFMTMARTDLYSGDLGGRPALTLQTLGIDDEPTFIGTRVGSSLAFPLDYTHMVYFRNTGVQTTVRHAITPSVATALFNQRIAQVLTNPWLRVTYLTPEQAEFWGAERGYRFAGGVDLINGNTIISFVINGVEDNSEAVQQAVHELWRDVKNWR